MINNNLFVYGKLCSIETRLELLNRVIYSTPKTLNGYNSSGTLVIENETYKYAFEDSSSYIIGQLIQLTPDEFLEIDIWETNAYVRKEIILSDGIVAWMYVKNEN